MFINLKNNKTLLAQNQALYFFFTY